MPPRRRYLLWGAMLGCGLATPILSSAFLVLLSAQAMAQLSLRDTLELQSNRLCGLCKQRIENMFLSKKGVVSVEVVLGEDVVRIIYYKNETSENKLFNAFTKLGYMASGVSPGRKLPEICRERGCGRPDKN